MTDVAHFWHGLPIADYTAIVMRNLEALGLQGGSVGRERRG